MREDVRLYVYRKRASETQTGEAPKPVLLLVHGSTVSGRNTYDLQVPGGQDYSVMDYFAARGYDVWTVDHEGYGRSSWSGRGNSDVRTGAKDLAAVVPFILSTTGVAQINIFGSSSGALRACLYTEAHPHTVARLGLSALVYTGEGSPTLEQRKKKLPEFLAKNSRPIDRAFVHSIFNRDHADCADEATKDAFADAILTLDASMPTGTYVDMCAKLPLIDPTQVKSPTLIMRGEYDGIASLDDLLDFFKLLPSTNKQFSIMEGISHASFQQKNYLMVYQILHSFFSQPVPVYRG
jgi:pimeloyl-ACP methyl ester carboxylesterase